MNAVLIMRSGNEFVARPDQVGTTDEELARVKDGTIDPDRLREVQTSLMRSALALELLAAGRKH